MSFVEMNKWDEEEDLMLAETVLRNARMGKEIENAFAECASIIGRTLEDCSNRWTTELKGRYDKALALAKKQSLILKGKFNEVSSDETIESFKEEIKEEIKEETETSFELEEKPAEVTPIETQTTYVEPQEEVSNNSNEFSFVNLMNQHLKDYLLTKELLSDSQRELEITKSQLNEALKSLSMVSRDNDTNVAVSKEYISRLEEENALLKEENKDFKKVLEIMQRAQNLFERSNSSNLFNVGKKIIN